MIGRSNGLAILADSQEIRIALRSIATRIRHHHNAIARAHNRVERGLGSGLFILDGRFVGDGGVGLGRLLLDRGLRLGDGLGGDLDRGAVGHVGGSEGVLAAVVGGDVGLGAVGSHGLDGSDLLPVIGSNRELEVLGGLDLGGLVGRVGGDVLLAVLVVGQRSAGHVELEGCRGVLGLGRGRLVGGGAARLLGGLGCLGRLSLLGRLGLLGLLDGLGLLGRLILLLRRLLGGGGLSRLRGLLRLLGLRSRGGVLLLVGRLGRLGLLGRLVQNDLLAAALAVADDDVSERLDVGGLQHEDDAQEDREHGLPLLHRLATLQVPALASLTHTNHLFSAGAPPEDAHLLVHPL